jgi:hypothetical protein
VLWLQKYRRKMKKSTIDISGWTSQAGEQLLHLVKLYVRACNGNKKTICHMTALLVSGTLTTILQEEVARQLGTRLNFGDVAVITLHGANTTDGKPEAASQPQLQGMAQLQPGNVIKKVLLW